MKQRFKNRINALRIAEPLPYCKIKNLQLDDFFAWFSEIGSINQHTSGDIRYRNISYINKEEGFEVSVTVIQTDKDDLIIIDANFGDED